jgi:outer membrane protein assembly factor BamB
MRLRPGRWRWLALAAIVIVLLAGGGALLLLSGEPGNVSNPDVEFHAAPPAATLPAPAPAQEGRDAFDWPVYGYTRARTRYLPLAKPLRPPFAEDWKLGGSVLLEFPPVMGGHSLYLLKNNGALYAISRKTGHVRFKRKLGDLAASSPAYADGTVYVVLLARGKGIKAGRVVAVSAKDGHTRWSKPLPSRSESSPLVAGGTVYFGSEDGTVYAMRASDGFVRWRVKAAGAVKAGLALADGKLFFGDYSGHVTALRAADGHAVWRKGTSGGKFGLSSGTFYATPSVAFGRVYLGNTDGFVYSYAESNGALAWRTKTGGFVYGAAAVAAIDGIGPTVYVGSYDGTFYALNAQTGKVRWQRKAEGRISGGAVLLGDLVFYSTLAHTTTALGARTGRKVWSTHRGGFNPVVSDGRHIYLVGFTSLFGLEGRPPSTQLSPTPPKLQRAARTRAAKRRVARRVARRRAAVHHRNELRRRGVRFCLGKGSHRVCRLPKPLVCFKRADGRTICRPREPRRP